MVAALGVPLASDLDQTSGGDAVWKKLMRTLPGMIKLLDLNGQFQTVEFLNGNYVPNP